MHFSPQHTTQTNTNRSQKHLKASRVTDQVRSRVKLYVILENFTEVKKGRLREEITNTPRASWRVTPPFSSAVCGLLSDSFPTSPFHIATAQCHSKYTHQCHPFMTFCKIKSCSSSLQRLETTAFFLPVLPSFSSHLNSSYTKGEMKRLRGSNNCCTVNKGCSDMCAWLKPPSWSYRHAQSYTWLNLNHGPLVLGYRTNISAIAGCFFPGWGGLIFVILFWKTACWARTFSHLTHTCVTLFAYLTIFSWAFLLRFSRKLYSSSLFFPFSSLLYHLPKCCPLLVCGSQPPLKTGAIFFLWATFWHLAV